MKTFPDNNGRTWTIDIDVSAIRRVRSLTSVDLMSLADGTLLQRLEDPVTLVDVLFAVVKAQADSANVSDEDFGRAMRGDAISLATDALLTEIVDFFPSARRETFRRLLAKGQQVTEAAQRLIETKLEAIDPELLVQTLGKSSMNALASSASIPAA